MDLCSRVLRQRRAKGKHIGYLFLHSLCLLLNSLQKPRVNPIRINFILTSFVYTEEITLHSFPTLDPQAFWKGNVFNLN